MPFSLERNDDAVVIGIDRSLIAGNRQYFKQLVLDEVTQGSRQFRVDFRETAYIDSSGLGVLVSVAKTIRDRGGDIRLANLNPDLRTLFALTKLDTLFRFEDGGDGLAGQQAMRTPTPPPPLAQHERQPQAPEERAP